MKLHREPPSRGERFVDGDIRPALIYTEATTLARQERIKAWAEALQIVLRRPPRR